MGRPCQLSVSMSVPPRTVKLQITADALTVYRSRSYLAFHVLPDLHRLVLHGMDGFRSSALAAITTLLC